MRRVPWPAAHCSPEPPEEPSMPPATIRPAETRPPLIAAVDGARGLLDGGAPPLLFVAVNAIAGAQTTRPVALAIASTAAVSTGLAPAAGKLLLGWPLTLLAVALTLALARRATRGRAPHQSPTAP